jgi:hypothetical protein
MSADLCNDPAIFKQLIESVFQGLTYEACLVYLDDVIIVGQTFHVNLTNLQVFQRILRHKLKAQGVSTVPEGGAVPGPLCITRKTTDPEKLKDVPQRPLQTDKQELSSLLASVPITEG